MKGQGKIQQVLIHNKSVISISGGGGKIDIITEVRKG